MRFLTRLAAVSKCGIIFPMKVEISVRIVLVGPPNGVQYALQRGKEEVVSPVRSDGSDLKFDLTLTLAGKLESGAPRFIGAFAQGPADERFVYIRIGTMAGDPGSCWTRRAKIHLAAITWAMVEEIQATPGSIIVGRFLGTGTRGEPACASMRPIGGEWTIKR